MLRPLGMLALLVCTAARGAAAAAAAGSGVQPWPRRLLQQQGGATCPNATCLATPLLEVPTTPDEMHSMLAALLANASYIPDGMVGGGGAAAAAGGGGGTALMLAGGGGVHCCCCSLS